jgi:hypothetical protein
VIDDIDKEFEKIMRKETSIKPNAGRNAGLSQSNSSTRQLRKPNEIKENKKVGFHGHTQ